jgi:uncharacterized membrane protein YphA (DoxX/SURF4 family)
MRYGRYGLPYLFLRIGLGLTFLWIGIDIFRQPEVWIGYVPAAPGFGVTREAALAAGGVFDVALGTLFILRIWTKLAGWLAAAHMLAIIAVHGIDPVLIRDVGLLGAGLAVAFWPARYRRRKSWWGLGFFPRRSSGNEE